ncbi:MAG: formylglycine-generating enzyme family protein [Planctomycetota bacterium]
MTPWRLIAVCVVALLPAVAGGRARADEAPGDHAPAADGEPAAAAVAAWLHAGAPPEGPLVKAVRELGVRALPALRAAAAVGHEARVDALRGEIVTAWQRAQTPAGMVFVPAGDIELPRARPPFGPSGVREHVPAFYLDRVELSAAAWRDGCRRHGLFRGTELLPPAASEDPWPAHVEPSDEWPATGMTWRQARTFAEVARGGRLPTAAEFERALRGSGVGTWPWGEPPDARRANLAGLGPGHPLPVGSLPEGEGPFGALDLVGNVAEWTATFRRRGSAGGAWPFALGGSWLDEGDGELLWRPYGHPDEPQGDTVGRLWIGFRVAKDVPWPPGEGPCAADPADPASGDRAK